MNKIKAIALSAISVILLTGCKEPRKPEATTESTNSDYNVEKLFTADGISVYRFTDNGRYVYFTNKTGEVRYTKVESRAISNGKTTRVVHTEHPVQTICNSDSVEYGE